MISKEKDYETIIKERSDSFLAYVPKAAEEEMLNEFEQWEKELSGVSVPKDTELKILKMADDFNKLHDKEKRRKSFSKYVRIAAVVILAITTVLTTLTFSVEAVRVKVFDFLFQENEEYMQVISVETSGANERIKSLLPDWANYYYPDYLPEGYRFEEAENKGLPYMMAFVNESGDVLLFSQQPADQGMMIMDNEGTEKGELTINENPAFWASKNNETTLVWTLNGTRFTAFGKVELEELVKLADNLIFIK
jgi:hypothetical protein